MVSFVVKKDGSRVAFNKEKMELALASACNDAQLPEENKNAVVKEISNLVLMDLDSREDITSGELRKMILSKLEGAYPEVAEAWQEFEETKNV
jgi:transcriptional regulator NrdR family protein